ncbi:hypothetical protein [Psychroserpens algicola]|uniref:DUF4181 domain-containing protein n=1 Tax=Psychroserpens algicola TaxID=1719034 RepID=A0ABT0H427_9FLAO|nr:hypothetical protein [Psychroserpens algicola]MCK8479135.1 hypothetical protein [Psychroserpens algicola]
MNYTLIIGLFFLAILLYKVFECVRRNRLSTLGKIKFAISAVLILSFLTTGYFLTYPDSLYWFIFSAVIILSLSLSSSLVRNELKRYMELSRKDKIINACYYTLILVSITIIF